MSDEPILPFDELLAPIAGDSPCGPLRRNEEGFVPALYDLRSLAGAARRKEKAASEANEDQLQSAMPDWRDVKDGAVGLLKETSKDLRITPVLLEALLRTDSFRGLADGFRLVGDLIERYWSDLVEAARAASNGDEQALNATISDLAGLGNVTSLLPDKIGLLLVTKGGDADDYAFWKYEQAVQTANATQEEREKRNAITMTQFTNSVLVTAKNDRTFFPRLNGYLEDAKAQIARLSDLLDERLTGDLANAAPPLSALRTRLEEVQTCLRHTAKDYLEVPVAAEAGGEAAGGAATNGNGGSGGGAFGGLNDREAAFRELYRIADFFARTEPLSLLSEQIRQIVDRGRLPPEKYYSQLIDDPTTLKQFFRLVGIKLPENDGYSSDS
jgi:type VI secretion system protein ImpA